MGSVSIVTVKTEVSRFHIHDELTAPDESAPILKSIQVGGRSVNKLVGVLAGSPAVLRAYTRMRAELQQGELPQATRHRIELAVAEHRGDTYSVVQYAKTARNAGLGLDEVSRARGFSSSDPREAALLTYLKAALEAEGDPPIYLHEEAREADWDDEQILEALAHVALGEFQSVMAAAAALPKDQATPRVLPEAA
jgi:alkylhydroperoxidase family enzyme